MNQPTGGEARPRIFLAACAFRRTRRPIRWWLPVPNMEHSTFERKGSPHERNADESEHLLRS